MSRGQEPEHKKTLVENHALNRLHKVEKEKRKPYVKQKSQFSFQTLLMGLIFLIVLIIMLISMI